MTTPAGKKPSPFIEEARRRRHRGKAINVESAAAAWKGAVERRDPASYRERCEQLTWMCRNPHCRQWTMNGAHLRGRCNFCGTARPSV